MPDSYPGEAAARGWAAWERTKKWAEQASFTHLPTGAVIEPNDALRQLAARYTASFLLETDGTLPQGPHELEELQLVYEFPFVGAIAAPDESSQSETT